MEVDGHDGDIKWIFTGANGKYLIGDFNGEHFAPHSGPFQMDTGRTFYASQVFSNIPPRDGRTIQITWMRGGNYPHVPFNQQLGFPCSLTLRKTPGGLRICRYPVDEIAGLRTATHLFENQPLADISTAAGRSADNQLGGISGDLFDIELTLAVGRAERIELIVGNHSVVYTPATGVIGALGAAGVAAVKKGEVMLRLLLDRTSLEIFGNQGEASMTSCLMPQSLVRKLNLHANGPGARIVSMAVHTLKSAWTGA